MDGSRSVPLGAPKRAKAMASNSVVLPAPVSPVMRYSPCVPSFSKSTSVLPAYGPKPEIVNLMGLIRLPPISSR